MSNKNVLEQTQNALHQAYAIIANAENCLGDGTDTKLAEQWINAATCFMEDYNSNLDTYISSKENSNVKIVVSYLTHGDDSFAVSVCSVCSSVLSIKKEG